MLWCANKNGPLSKGHFHRAASAVAKVPQGRIGQEAFSVIEVLVGVAIVAISLVSLFAGISSSFVLTKSAREDLRATQIILERLEGIRLHNWNQLVYSNMVPTDFTTTYYPMAKQGESVGITYRGTVVIDTPVMDPPASYSANMRSVTVSVFWTNYYGPRLTNELVRSRTMTTYQSRDGIQNYVFNN
jgi:type II secretory pathway pseudopilin PulG